MKNVTVRRVNYLHVSIRANNGAPRMFQAKVGAVDGRYICECKNGMGKGCSHEKALMEFLHEEAAQQAVVTAVPAHA